MEKDDLQLGVCGTRQVQSLLLFLARRPRKVRGFGGAAVVRDWSDDDDGGESRGGLI